MSNVGLLVRIGPVERRNWSAHPPRKAVALALGCGSSCNAHSRAGSAATVAHNGWGLVGPIVTRHGTCCCTCSACGLLRGGAAAECRESTARPTPKLRPCAVLLKHCRPPTRCHPLAPRHRGKRRQADSRAPQAGLPSRPVSMTSDLASSARRISSPAAIPLANTCDLSCQQRTLVFPQRSERHRPNLGRVRRTAHQVMTIMRKCPCASLALSPAELYKCLKLPQLYLCPLYMRWS